MKPVKNIAELRTQFLTIKTGVAGDTLFLAKAALLSCEKLAELLRKQPRRRARRQSTAWQKFLGEGLRQRKSFQVIAEEWKQKKDGAGA